MGKHLRWTCSEGMICKSIESRNRNDKVAKFHMQMVVKTNKFVGLSLFDKRIRSFRYKKRRVPQEEGCRRKGVRTSADDGWRCPCGRARDQTPKSNSGRRLETMADDKRSLCLGSHPSPSSTKVPTAHYNNCIGRWQLGGGCAISVGLPLMIYSLMTT